MGFRENNFLHKLKVREMGLSENGSFGRPREENGTLATRESFVTLKTGVCYFGEENGFCNFENLHKLVCLKMVLFENGFCNF